MNRLIIAPLPDDGTLDPVQIHEVPNSDQLMRDLDKITKRMWVYGSRGEREAAQRLRAAAELEPA